MTAKALLLAGISASMLGSISLPASATPAVNFNSTYNETSAVEQVNYRRCWRRHGHLVCGRYGYAPSYYDDGYYGYGYGPGVGLYFGGGGRGWGGGHHGGGHRGHR